MICKKCKKTKEKKLNKEVKVEWNIPKGIDAEHQVQMIGLTKEDLRIIHNLQPFVNEQIDDIVNRFYENLENEPSLLDLINDNSSIEKLRKMLRTHITEMFNGVINQEYFERRIRIAHIHVQVGLKTKWYLCAFQDLLLSLIGIIEENFEDKEEYFLAIKAVSKILNLEQQLVLESYDIEMERIRKKAEDQKILVRNNVATASENLATISEETSASFRQLIEQSNEVVYLVNKETELSLLAEKRAEEGKEQIKKQNNNMGNINHSVNDISFDIKMLTEISK